ncbi:hypothetical protein SFRURICE_015304 [Spodoptera frugiperda]|nr:hypothetical protein SFRURICE_015304 [Spodoptera frugiperda]
MKPAAFCPQDSYTSRHVLRVAKEMVLVRDKPAPGPTQQQGGETSECLACDYAEAAVLLTAKTAEKKSRQVQLLIPVNLKAIHNSTDDVE